MRIVLMFVLLSCSAWAQGAQNTDLTGMVGGIGSSSVTFPGTVNASGAPTSLFFARSAAFIGQISYAYQLPKPGTGHIWIEVPVTVFVRGSDTIDGNSPLVANAWLTDTWLITPGLRFKSRKFGRVSFYGAVGGGLGLFNTIQNGVSGPNETVFARTSVQPHPVFDCAGGIDVRLSRLLSLRAELRDFVSTENAWGISAHPGHNHWAPVIGLAFHL
jgi:hypothetical protein